MQFDHQTHQKQDKEEDDKEHRHNKRSLLDFLLRKKPISLEVWQKLTTSLGARDKVLKIIQYSSIILLWYYSQESSRQTSTSTTITSSSFFSNRRSSAETTVMKDRISAAKAGASMARKGFRLLRSINHILSVRIRKINYNSF